MPSLPTKIKKTYRDEGAIHLLKRVIPYLYNNIIRSSLPRQIVLYNGVPVRAARLGDSFVPWQETDIDNYEGAIIRRIQDHVQMGDTVVIVGGGWGISTVIAAREAGKHGEVITYEGAKQAVENIRDTLKLNNISENVLVRHAVVAEDISLRSPVDGGKTVPATDLPDCDSLVLDCEGAELTILEKMEIQPRVLVVETHGLYGAPKEDVQNKLESMGYKVVSEEIAERRHKRTCIENSIYVLTAIRQ